ncbi:MAG: D-alanine--D-alanine ligase [Bacteroidetes bacterium]|nr:D-alanine--D-alanine ligase [Bacteroidota bacterium]
MKVGIFFGGSSREREISFVGGRTIYDRLDKSLFEPIPIFVDSFNNFIILNWQYLYKGTIRDFYPPKEYIKGDFSLYIESLNKLPKNEYDQLIRKIGKQIYPHEFSKHFDFAFLTLHGNYGEDGTIQGIMEWYNIPYSGTGILGSALNIDKEIQRKYINSSINEANLNKANLRQYHYLESETITFNQWINKDLDKKLLYEKLKSKFGSQFICKSCKQGSSIGVTMVESFETFENNINKCFFIKEINKSYWKSLSNEAKDNFIKNKIVDIRYGLGLPILIKNKVIYSAEEVLDFLNNYFSLNGDNENSLLLESFCHEQKVIIEKYLIGKEFSCIVIEDDEGNPVALPPTELNLKNNIFDYRAKYLPGIANKITPININLNQFLKIKSSCEQLYKDLNCNIYARIDGFFTKDEKIYLNDPNTSSGMNPSSFLFHQSAEIGFTPTQFLTFIIKKSIDKFLQKKNNFISINQNILTFNFKNKENHKNIKSRVGVLLGGFSSERHISLESGRNIYDKLASSKEFEPIPIFLSGNKENHRLFILPINILLKDNADDIHDKLLNLSNNIDNEILTFVRKETNDIVKDYNDSINFDIKEVKYKSLKEYIDFAFIALHGRPGEDGEMQKILEKEDVPYNGSNIDACNLTMDKYKTNQFLNSHGIKIAKQKLITKENWSENRNDIINELERELKYPMIGKPLDEGCSSAVLKLNDRKNLELYIDAILRDNNIISKDILDSFDLKSDSEFPNKQEVLIEEFISKNHADHFLEITVGLNTEFDEKSNEIKYNIFEPSESISKDKILSLEEKFLAGEGENITPARFSQSEDQNNFISNEVKNEILKVAKLLKIEGYARIDAFVRIFNDRIEVIIIEINTLPAMTPATCIFHQAALFGYKPLDFIKNIINYGLSKNALKIV